MVPYPNTFSPTRQLCSLAIVALVACSNSGTDLYPLDSGRWWHFQTETVILDEHRQQRFLLTNLGLGTHGGEPVSIQRQSTGREVYFRRTSRGIERVGVRIPFGHSVPAQDSALVLPANPAVGESWIIESRLALIESRTFARQDKLHNLSLPFELTMSIAATNDTVRTPAGIFEGCVRFDGNGSRTVRTDRGNATAEVFVAHQEWYAPGIGLIKATRSETSDSPFLKAGHYSQEMVQFGR